MVFCHVFSSLHYKADVSAPSEAGWTVDTKDTSQVTDDAGELSNFIPYAGQAVTIALA